jgi:hypothetical protein
MLHLGWGQVVRKGIRDTACLKLVWASERQCMNTGAHDQASPADTSMSVTCRVNKPTVRGSLEKRAGRTVGCLRVATFTGRTQVRPGFKQCARV